MFKYKYYKYSKENGMFEKYYLVLKYDIFSVKIRHKKKNENQYL